MRGTIRYIYDDDEEEELFDFYDEDPYPDVIIGINEEKFMEIYEEVRRRTQ